jgi:toxin ParE1/3/4
MDDISAIFSYIELCDSIRKAENVVHRLETHINDLSHMPDRGQYVKELYKIGLKESHIKEIHVKPYRVIYKIDKQSVYILAVLDGRRELDDLLNRRVFGF